MINETEKYSYLYTDYFLNQKYEFNNFDDYIAKVNSWDNYKLPDDYDNTINRLNNWACYQYKPGIYAGPHLVKTNLDGSPDLSDSIDAGPYITRLDKNGNPIVYTVANDLENN